VRGILWSEQLLVKVEETKGKEGEKNRRGVDGRMAGWQDARTNVRA